LGKFNFIAWSNEDHTVRDVEGKCGVSTLSVTATDRVAGDERKGCYNTVQKVKAQATNPGEKRGQLSANAPENKYRGQSV